MTPPSSLYTWEEHVLLDPPSSDTAAATTGVRLETLMGWSMTENSSGLVHPFGNLVRLLSPLLQASTTSTSSSSDDDDERIQIRMSIASRANSQASSSQSSLMSRTPLTSKIKDSSHHRLPQFPSGFSLEVITESHFWTLAQLQNWVDQWRDHRILTTPLEDAESWDLYQENGYYYHRIFLPTNGVAWSADALHQFFTHALPSSCHKKDGNWFGQSAMDWSQLLFQGDVLTKSFWFQVSTKTKTSATNAGQRVFTDLVQAQLGLQFQTSRALEDLDHFALGKELQGENASSLLASSSSCPLWTQPRQMQHLENVRAPTVDLVAQNLQEASIHQVLRKPYPNQGRLEAWFDSVRQPERTSPSQCYLQVRQRFPSFVEPIWHSLFVMANEQEQVAGGIPTPRESETNTAYPTHLEWDETDGSRVLTVTSPLQFSISSSLLISVDYEAVLLSIDNFPGDPNRGRELPPTSASVRCIPETTSMIHNTAIHEWNLYSNSVLILPPVPDMSMPFNVLSLTCSLYAYLIGTIVTLLVKRSSEKIRYERYPDQKPKSTLAKVKERIQAKFRVLRGARNRTSSTDKQEEEQQETTPEQAQTSETQ